MTKEKLDEYEAIIRSDPTTPWGATTVSQLIALARAGLEAKEIREQLKVSEQISDTFWQALKLLNLQAINVQNPGQHVTDLIRELATLKQSLAPVRKLLGESQVHSSPWEQLQCVQMAIELLDRLAEKKEAG